MKTQVEHLVLKRETFRVSLLRMEDAARTEQDFEAVVNEWDRYDKLRERRENRKEDPTEEIALKREALQNFVIPEPRHHVWWRKTLNGNFDDVIFDCPHEIQDLVTSETLYLVLKKLNEGQKEVLYYRAIRDWSPQQLAVHRGQTDRNIRKVYATLIAKIHRELKGGRR